MLTLGPFASRREISLAPEVAAGNRATWENVVSCYSPAHIGGFHTDVLSTVFAGLSNRRLNGTFTRSVSKPTHDIIALRIPGPVLRSPTSASW